LGFQKLEKNVDSLEAVAFVINSPGGSAVESNNLGNSLRTFCDKNNLKLYTFAEEVAASGGYWLLSIGDEAYSYESSKVGSIGVVWTSYDFKNFLEKRKIERLIISSKKDDK
jgi:ClpP class serine protease